VTILIPLERQREDYALLDTIRRGARIEHFETVHVSLTISAVRGNAGKSWARQKLLVPLLSASEAMRK
jgi:hypothetical protein